MSDEKQDINLKAEKVVVEEPIVGEFTEEAVRTGRFEHTMGMSMGQAMHLVEAHTSDRMAKIAGRVLRAGHAEPDDAMSLAGCVLRQYINGKL